MPSPTRCVAVTPDGPARQRLPAVVISWLAFVRALCVQWRAVFSDGHNAALPGQI
jgi:hypothetical protein